MPEAAALRLLTLKLLLAVAGNSLLLLTATAVHGVGEARAHLRFPLLRLFLLHLRVLTVALDGADIPHLGLRMTRRMTILKDFLKGANSDHTIPEMQRPRCCSRADS